MTEICEWSLSTDERRREIAEMARARRAARQGQCDSDWNP
jgi:predicted Fe-S protein YdhL (DUF1289 family)